MIETKVIIGTIRTSEVGTTLVEVIGIEVNMVKVKEEILGLKTDHIIKGRSRDRDDGGIFRSRRESRSISRDRSSSRDRSVERRCHYCTELCQFMRECQKKKKDQVKQEQQKAQMQ